MAVMHTQVICFSLHPGSVSNPLTTYKQYNVVPADLAAKVWRISLVDQPGC